MTPPDILGGLTGLRLALYDEALAAGPRGLSCAELRARTAEDRERLGCTASAERAAWAWLAAQGLLREYQPDRWRGIALAEAQPVAGDPNPKPETPNPKPVCSALRTPALETKTRRGGQLAFL